jgi:predicted RND superfamily exporter protein
MDNKEKISRFLGAAISECSASKYDEVKKMLVAAMRRLGDVREERPGVSASKTPASFAGMSSAQKNSTINLIDEMIESEKSRLGRGGRETNLFG